MNVEFDKQRHPPMACAQQLFARLMPQVEAWRRAGALRLFSFLRKPPDSRLRFQADTGSPLAVELRALLDGLREAGFVRAFHVAPYTPETFQFGGPWALHLVHRWFDADSVAWWRWVSSSSPHGGSPRALCAAVGEALVSACVGPREEVWDVWCNLARLHGMPDARILAVREAPCAAPDAEAGVAHAARLYGDAHRELGAGLARLGRTGRLACGERALLPFVLLFHWNRYGLSLDDRAALLAPMLAKYSPKRGLVGVTPTRGEP
ncbi:thiopeptide-type bacteriocin biosynthesis protein [Corallococcus sp. CA049B]|uniref:thiopeptide-type bacteriocin biosynthesis protein n=1 Tax=Corallococcus sp. CA049B TaxID=2316730 RepID=UPI0013154672|nr:thiopeptide-type bacteriocin biosynthesis protein [Corallococcus sp. CA049B]